MTKVDVMLWDQEKTGSVRASAIRSFGIYQESCGGLIPLIRFKLLGWLNANESFYFGSWNTKQQAQMFLMDLHKQIEGKE